MLSICESVDHSFGIATMVFTIAFAEVRRIDRRIFFENHSTKQELFKTSFEKKTMEK